jgi:hypothetical protein
MYDVEHDIVRLTYDVVGCTYDIVRRRTMSYLARIQVLLTFDMIVKYELVCTDLY